MKNRLTLDRVKRVVFDEVSHGRYRQATGIVFLFTLELV